MEKIMMSTEPVEVTPEEMREKSKELFKKRLH